ncbi:hypothetical protein CLAIMM_07817 [Cladophialophora immunda]|nr:hypothetical protein CLAIMM_07817 [Cladophialophora immunda]
MLTVARPQDEITAWWYSGRSSSSATIAADAYARAVEYFERELAETQSERAWIRGVTSLEDVKKIVEQARDSYEDRSEHHARAKRWIDTFAANMGRYGAVLDILANADPLHAGLAWGAIKFVFAGVSTYSQHAAELAKALAQIGDVLPRIRVELALYTTTQMTEAVAQLYAHILLFLQRAVTWYNANRTRRVLKAVFRPSQLSFQETVADIGLCTKNVEMIANTAGRAEIRGQSFALEEQTIRQRQIEQRLLEMQARLEEVSISSRQHDQRLQRLIQHTLNSHDLLKSIKFDTGDSRPVLTSLQVSQIIQALRPAALPEDVLRVSQSFSRRRISWQQNDRATMMMIKRLKEWTWFPRSSMFTVKTAPPALQRTLDMVVEVTTLLKSTPYPIFWCISNPGDRKRATAVSDILRSLIFQALRQDPSIPSRDAQLGDISSYERPHSLDEWRLEALDPRVSAAVAQPVVDTALRQHKLPQVGKTKEGDAHCQSIQETKPREWQWDDPDDRDNEGSRELVRRVRVRGGEERRSGVRKNMQVPSHRPHTSYLFLRAVGGYIDESLKTVRTEIWDDPDDSSCILIRRQQQLTDESQLSDSDSEDVDATPQTPENGFLSPRIEFPLHIGLRNDNERLSTVLRDNEIPTLKALRQSPPTKLSHLTYTLSEDRSGDSGSVIRQLLSALRSLAGFVPIVNKGGTTRLEGAAEVIWPCNSLGSEFREEYWFLAPIYKRVWVKYARAKISGWTEFPEPLVCGEALEQLGYSDWLLNDVSPFYQIPMDAHQPRSHTGKGESISVSFTKSC